MSVGKVMHGGRSSVASSRAREATGAVVRPRQRGVSPVVGIVLLVAITVLLVGTAGAFFLGFTDDVGGPSAPTVAFSSNENLGSGSDTLGFTVKSSEGLGDGTVHVVVSGASCGGSVDPNKRYTPTGLGVTGDLTAGTTLPLDKRALCRGPANGPLDLSAARVSVVWVDAGDSTGTTYTTWEGPAA